MPAGRPSLYRDQYPEQARKLALLGLTDVQLAGFFGVNADTIYEWDKAHPEFAEARARGKETADAEVAASLWQRAIGYEHDAVKIFMPAGASAPVYAPYREKFAPDVAAAGLWLTNRRRGDWMVRSTNQQQQLDKDGNPMDPVIPVVKVTFSDG